jgi:short-subunit dehydrogenase
MPTMQTHQTQTVLITGASRGIGRETALRYASRGARLVLAARGVADLEKVAGECLEAGAADAVVQPTDISEMDGVRELFRIADTRFGGVDIVVQNAALAAFGRFLDVPAEVFDTVIRANVTGAAHVAREALTRFRDQGHGQLVVVGSLLGHTAVPYMGAYVMSKFAITGLVRILRQEVREMPGVVVHAIYPGAVDTPIYSMSANFFGRRAHVQPFSDTPAKMARAIVAATDRGRSSESQVGLANLPMLVAYRALPRVYDAIVGPMMRALSFSREQLGPTAGNAFTQVDDTSSANT